MPSLALACRLSAVSRASRRPFSPASLFSSGEQGVWYDPSDYSTLFQDAAGTIPVTAVEQPVGKILDKSGRGNHATQSTTTSRPTLSARYNLLTKTEQFDDAAWQLFKSATKTGTNVAIAPDGTATADSTRLSSVESQIFQNVSFVATSYVLSCFVKRNASSDQVFRLKSTTVPGVAIYSENLTATAEWQRFSITFLATAHSGNIAISAVAAGTTADLLIWGADLRVANDGVGLPAYQRVDTATDYDYAGFPPYLKFDGTDDGMATGNIDFTGTDKMTVWAGYRPIGSTGVITELSTRYDENQGSFLEYISYAGLKAGSSYTDAFVTNNVNTTYIRTSSFDGASTNNATKNSYRLNGVLQAPVYSGSPTGTSMFGNYPLYICRRGGTSHQFNGRLYSLVVCGKLASAAEIASTENWIEVKTFGKDMNYVYSDEVLTAASEQITTADGQNVYMTVTYQ